MVPGEAGATGVSLLIQLSERMKKKMVLVTIPDLTHGTAPTGVAQ